MGEQPGEGEDGLAGVLDVAEHAGRVEAFEEHGARGRVVVEEAYRAVAVPDAQGGRFVLGLLVEDLEFEDGGRAVVAAYHGQDEGGPAVHGGSVEAEVPVVEAVGGEGGQAGDEGAAGVSVVLRLGGGEGVRNVDHTG